MYKTHLSYSSIIEIIESPFDLHLAQISEGYDLLILQNSFLSSEFPTVGIYANPIS